MPDRGAAKLAAGLLLFFSLAALFGALTLYQATSEGTAKRTLRRAVATLTEIDPLINRNFDDLRQRAAVAGPGDSLTLRDYPIAVPLTAPEARTISKAGLRRLLLDRSAAEMYSKGTAALRSQAAKGGSVGVFSVAGITNHGLDFLRARNHAILRVLTLILAASSLALAAALAWSCRGFGRMGSVGLVTLAAALPVLLAGAAMWLYARLQGGGGAEYTQQQFAAIGRELAWIPIRDGAAFAVLGSAMVLLGVALGAWSDRRQTPRYGTARPNIR
ncbi:MAG: hypothetical protein ACYC9X_11120 [Dehalococcoidia bacterium]